MNINRNSRGSNISIPASSSSYYNRLGHTTTSSTQNGSAHSLGLSSIKSKSSMAKMASFLASKNVNDCEYCKQSKKLSCSHSYIVKNMVRKKLYIKYASSQNYYYTRDINEILANGRT
jgi:hypothetical protein